VENDFQEPWTERSDLDAGPTTVAGANTHFSGRAQGEIAQLEAAGVVGHTAATVRELDAGIADDSTGRAVEHGPTDRGASRTLVGGGNPFITTTH